MTLSPGMLRALKLLLAEPDDGAREIVCDGLHCMIGLTNVARRTVRGLLMHMAIKDAGYAGAGVDIYAPTPNSAAIVKRPALADEMVARVIARRPFFVDDAGQVQDVAKLMRRLPRPKPGTRVRAAAEKRRGCRQCVKP